MSDKTLERELSDLRERVVRVEVQITEMTKRIEALSNYTRQLYEYLNKETINRKIGYHFEVSF